MLKRRKFLQLSALTGMAASCPWLLAGCDGNGGQDMPTLEQKVAQMLMIGFRGTTLTGQEPIVRDIQHYEIGGVVLFDYDVVLQKFGRNIVSPPQVRALCAQLQQFSREPLLIAVDQEGGRVARLKASYGFPATVSAQYLGDRDDMNLTRSHADSIANTLAQHGMNLNFAPVVDLNLNPDNPIIGRLERSFGATPIRVSRHAREFVEAHTRHRISSCLKHFPGHGSSTADSHLGFVDVSDTWRDIELEPYRQLISENRCPMIMTAHIFNHHLDPEYPATLSEAVISGLLRKEMGYDGVVVTDDMQMGAISQNYSYPTAVWLTLLAGVDIILVANNSIWDPEVVPRTMEMILNLVRNGLIAEARIDASYNRIRALKRQFLHP